MESLYYLHLPRTIHWYWLVGRSPFRNLCRGNCTSGQRYKLHWYCLLKMIDFKNNEWILKWNFNVIVFTSNHDLFKHFIFNRRVEADEIHASLTTEVASVEPIPVLELVPWLSPRQKVMMIADLAMGNTLGLKFKIKLVFHHLQIDRKCW